MALEVLLTRGIHALEGSARAELMKTTGDASVVERALSALAAMPSVLTALSEITWNDDAPEVARAVFPVAVAYLFKHDDLIPAHANQTALGILDDAYVVFLAAEQVAGLMPAPLSSALRKHREAIVAVLPERVISELEQMLAPSLTEATAQLEQRGA